MTIAEKRQLWEIRVSDFRSSNQRAPQWCAAHDVKLHQLRYWIRKFRSMEEKPTAKATQWLSVEVGEIRSCSHSNVLPIRVGKVTIEVRPGFDPNLLSDVVRTLAAL